MQQQLTEQPPIFSIGQKIEIPTETILAVCAALALVAVVLGLGIKLAGKVAG